MKSKRNWVFLMMYLTLSCRCIIEFLPFFNLYWISTSMASLCYLSMLYCTLIGMQNKEILYDKKVIIQFIIYTLFLYYQLFISAKIPINQCEGLPEDSLHFFRSTFEIIMLSLMGLLCSRYLDFERFAKWTVFLTLAFLAIYNKSIGFAYYTLAYDINGNERDLLLPDFFMGALSMNGYIGLMLCCNMYLYNKWTKNQGVNNVIFGIIVVLGFILQSLLVERGPFLFLIVTMIIMFVAKGRLKPRYASIMVTSILLCIVFSDSLIELFQSFFPNMAEKFLDTSGSGRYGGSNSITSQAIRQIMERPLFGDFCRMTSMSLHGTYPHNIILELLMTFGFVFTIPIIFLLCKAFIQSYRLIKCDRPESLFALFFIYRTLCLMTSGTIVCNTQFWFSFVFVLTTTNYINYKNINA